MVVKLGNLGAKEYYYTKGFDTKHATTKNTLKFGMFFCYYCKNIYQNGLVSRVDIGYIGREKEEEEEEEEEEEKSRLFCHFFILLEGEILLLFFNSRNDIMLNPVITFKVIRKYFTSSRNPIPFKTPDQGQRQRNKNYLILRQ